MLLALIFHGLLFVVLASMPVQEFPAALSFPVELLAPESAQQQPARQPEKAEPKRVSTPRPVPAPPQLVKRETVRVTPLPNAVTAPAAPATPSQAAALASVPTSDSAPAKPVEPGSSPSQLRTDAAYLVPPAPAYPNLSKRLGETGKVFLRVHVQPDGQPDQVEVRTGSGSTRLDNAAMEAVRRARFVPRRVAGVAVDQWVLVPISFNLEN